MKPEEIYIQQVLAKLPPGPLQTQIAMELRSHIADHLERGHSVAEAIRQLGDPAALAESYLAAVPLVAAPHGRRIAAKLVDVAILVAILAVVAVPVMIATLGPGSGGPNGTQRWDWRLVEYLSRGGPFHDVWPVFAAAYVLLASVSYLVFLMTAEARTGQTIGKRMLGLRVVTETGTRISLGQAFLRQLPVFLQILMIDALFALFTDKRQRAFELLSKTRVVVAHEPPAREQVPADSPLPVAL
jgi:uncharacterized RDD family membrane protein YckC